MTASNQQTPESRDDASERVTASRTDVRLIDRDSPGLLTISRLMKSSRPVFIVGEARSGSTILFRSLLMQPHFRPKEENLQESSFIVQAPSAGRFDQTSPRNLRRFMLEDEVNWGRYLTSLNPIRGWLNAAERIGPGFGARWLLAPSKLAARSYLFHAQQARGCRRVLEKTPNHVEHIPRLLSCFPKAHILYVHRHPVDVYSSYVRRGMVDAKADWARISPDEFCRLYRRRTRKVLDALRQRPDVVRLIRYGDLTADPETHLAAICDFVDARFEPQTLTALDDPDQWAHWERSRHLYEGIKTHTKEWRDYLSSADAQWIQDQLAPEMQILGHDPDEIW
jgi:hypothetical protein